MSPIIDTLEELVRERAAPRVMASNNAWAGPIIELTKRASPYAEYELHGAGPRA